MKQPSPSPAYSPGQVIQIQLEAMQHNDDPSPDAGIAVAFKFASPENQAQTGPLERFVQMVKTPAYAPMINHKSAEYGPIKSDNQQAQELVKITGADGEEAIYVFILHKQTQGQFKDCWMTDGVVRLKPGDLAPPPPPQPGNNGDGAQTA